MKTDHTFVVCAYKESPYLEHCIKSLLNQTKQSHVIISTSTANSYIKDIAEQYKLSLFVHDGGGIGKDWNFGLSCANTKYITLAHQDDIYLPDYLESILHFFDKDEESLIAFTDYNEIDEAGHLIARNRNLRIKRILLKPIQYFPKSKFIRERSFSFGNAISCPAVTYNKERLDDFLFNTDLSVSLDWEAWWRIGKMKGSFIYVDKILMSHRIHNESETTNAISENRRTLEDQQMFEKYWPKPIATLLMRAYIYSQKTN